MLLVLFAAEFIDQVMVDSPAGVIPPDRMFDLLRERGEYSYSPPVLYRWDR